MSEITVCRYAPQVNIDSVGHVLHCELGAGYVKFQNMENDMEELRRVTKFTIQQFVAHLATNPTRSPEMNQAAEILLEIFATHTPGTDEPRMPRRVAVASSPEFDIFARDIPKGKR